MTIDKFTEEAKAMRPMLLSVAKGLLGDDEAAEDVVQDALLRLWQLRDEPIHNLRGMARIVVRNRCLDIVRQRKTSVDLADVNMAEGHEEDTDEERIERMMVLVGQLPLMQQTVLRLRHLEGMSMGDIAALVGSTEAAVRQSLSRARRSIAEQFKNQEQ
ncbi:MAG: sigma-70 family RNA polymerase sigma factor [Prevotella sp.]|nr:sigma-70 family RNA polymerase sigma factor [Prevotella sp.]